MADAKPRLSVVVAAFNEQGNLPILRDRLLGLDWASMAIEPEFIFVDDHSKDKTSEILCSFAAADPRFKVLRFSRNFGSHKAFTAGLDHATGDAAVILAADLQDPPETIPLLLEKWRGGAKVVWAIREERVGVSLFSQIAARSYYWLMRKFTEVQPPRKGADFLLVDRQVVEALRTAPEKHTSLLALIQWLGFDQDDITYTKEARLSGRSKWTLRKKLKLALDSFVSFSYAPIRLMSFFGTLFALTGFCYTSVIIFRAMVYGIPVQGWASLMCALLIVSGVQLIMLGVLGEYMWRTFDEARGRPRYIIEKKINL